MLHLFEISKDNQRSLSVLILISFHSPDLPFVSHIRRARCWAANPDGTPGAAGGMGAGAGLGETSRSWLDSGIMAEKYLGPPLMHCWGWPWHRIFVLPELRSGSAECEGLKLKLLFSSSFPEVSWILIHPETSTALKTEQVPSSEGPLDLKALAVKNLTMEHPIFRASHVRIFSVQQRFLHLNRETKHSNSPHWSIELYNPASRSQFATYPHPVILAVVVQLEAPVLWHARDLDAVYLDHKQPTGDVFMSSSCFQGVPLYPSYW